MSPRRGRFGAARPVRWIALAGLAAACSHRSVTSCAEDLQGAYRDPAGHRWMVLDHVTTLEAYPIFDDSMPAAADVVAAPRLVDLTRADGVLSGTVHRRFARRADHCDARAPIVVTACRGDTLELSLADPQAPTGFAPCTWPAAPAPRDERWQRE